MPANLRGTLGNDTLTSHDATVSRIYGYRGDDVLDLSQRGGGAFGGMGDDIFYGGGDGVRQSHMYGGPGHDTFYLNTANQSAPYGDHVWGNEGADQFHFTTDPSQTARITGRIDDFDYSRDSLWLNGARLDLTDLPDNVRIIQHHSQPWILIDDRILYALEGARQFEGAYDADYDGDGESIAFGNGETEEAHFIPWPEIWADGVPASADLPYHDLQSYFPRNEVQSNLDEWVMPSNHYTDRPDSILGTDGNERLIGGDGADTIRANGGNDLIHGGEYDDILHGGEGNDSISGGLDNDYIDGGDGNDRIYGGSGADTIHGRGGHDFIGGSSGLDVLYGDRGNDTLTGGWSDDTLYGGDGNDHLYAAFPEVFEEISFIQSAELYGGDGDDSLYSEVNGEALIDGGEGADDIFMAEGAIVEIANFQPGIDYVDLNGVSPGPERLNSSLSEQNREDGSTNMVLSLGTYGSLTFLGMAEADRAAILASIGQEGPPVSPPDPDPDDDDDDDDDPDDNDDNNDDEEEESDGTCFVATACYGGAAHPDVAWLRQFRTHILRKSVPGRAFIVTYWIIGPHLAKLVHHRSNRGRMMRSLLGQLVNLGRKAWPML